MEDAATAEISRSQLWQWRHHGTLLADGRPMTAELYTSIRDEELARNGGRAARRMGEAADLLDRLVLADGFAEFLTLGAYPLLTDGGSSTTRPRTSAPRRRSTNRPNPRWPTNRPSRTTNDPRTIVDRTPPVTRKPSYGV